MAVYPIRIPKCGRELQSYKLRFSDTHCVQHATKHVDVGIYSISHLHYYLISKASQVLFHIFYEQNTITCFFA